MRYALFLGCTIPVRSQNYELSARAVAKHLGVELIDLKEFSCCGFPVKSSSFMTSMVLAARNLAIAAEEGMDICTLCNACTGVLTEANVELQKNDELRDRVNDELADIDREYKKGVRVRHFSRLLYEEIGIEKIRDEVKFDLGCLNLAVHYGCHYLKPKELYDDFDDPENPCTLDKLVEATGARSIDYRNKLDCCGGAILGVQEGIALSMAKNKLDNIMDIDIGILDEQETIGLTMTKRKLDNLTDIKVDALVTQCPFCTIMYEDNRKKVESKFDVHYSNLPVLYYPQVLGLALGYDPKQLGFRLNKIKAKALLEKLEGEK